MSIIFESKSTVEPSPPFLQCYLFTIFNDIDTMYTLGTPSVRDDHITGSPERVRVHSGTLLNSKNMLQCKKKVKLANTHSRFKSFNM